MKLRMIMPKYRDDSSRRVAARLITVLAMLLVIVPTAVGATGDTSVPVQDPNGVVPAPFNAQMSWSQEGGWHWVNLAYTGDNTTVGTPISHASYVATLVLTLGTTAPCDQCVQMDGQNEGPPTILNGTDNPQLAPAYQDLDNGPRHQQADGSWPIGAWYLNYSPTSHSFFSWTWIPGVAQSVNAQMAQFGTVSTTVGASERVFPLAGQYTETQPFGCVAANPGYPTVASCPPDKPSFHNGVDLAAAAGTPIVAAASGTVVFAGMSSDKSDANSQIIIQHDGANAGYQTMYLHWEKAFVKAGDHVAAGQEIALVGSVGYSTGPHLHFSVFDASGNAIDPLGWLKGATVPAISTASVSVAGTAGVLQWKPMIDAAAKQYNVPSAFIAAIMTIESSGDPTAVSVVGAQGLLQVMPAEMASLGVAQDKWLDPATNIAAGARLMAAQLANGASLEQVAASYFGQGCDAYGTCTDQYVARVMAWYAYYAQLFAGQPATLVMPPAANPTTQLASQNQSTTTDENVAGTSSATPPATSTSTNTPNPAPSEQAAVAVAPTTPAAKTATPSPTPSKTVTPTPATVAATSEPTATPTPSPTGEPTATNTPQSTTTATPTPAKTATPSPTGTATPKATTTAKPCPAASPTATSTPEAKATADTSGCTPPPCPTNASTAGKDGQPSATPTATPSATTTAGATSSDQGCVPPCSTSVTADGTSTPTATTTPVTCDATNKSATPEATATP